MKRDQNWKGTNSLLEAWKLPLLFAALAALEVASLDSLGVATEVGLAGHSKGERQLRTELELASFFYMRLYGIFKEPV